MRRRIRTLVVLVSTIALVAGVLPPALAEVPDQVHPPAPGEGEPLEDPTEPEPPAFELLSVPRVSVQLTGPTWRRPAVSTLQGSNAVSTAVSLSRSQYPGRARAAVIARHDRWPALAAGAGLAARAQGPLLVGPPSSLPGAVRDELRRLRPQRVYLIGVNAAVEDAVRGLGFDTWRANNADQGILSRRVAEQAAGALPARADIPEIAAACAPAEVPRAGLFDLVGSPHELAGDCLAWYGIVRGVSAFRYDAAGAVTRGQTASLLVRLLDHAGADLPDASDQGFRDIAGSAHAGDINRLAAAGVIKGYDARTFGPNDPVTRGQFAELVVRAIPLVADPLPAAPRSQFRDTRGTSHEDAIDRAAHAGLVRGVGDGRYAPYRDIRRDHVAVLLARLLNRLTEDGITSPPAAGEGARPAQPVVIVAQHDAEKGLGGTALAAGIGAPVLVVSGATSRADLAAAVGDLDGTHVYVAADWDTVPSSLLEGLPATRISAGGPATAAARLADEAASVGLRGRPAIVPLGTAHGVAVPAAHDAGRHHSGPVLVTEGVELSGPTMDWLANRRPARVALVNRNVDPVARCQLGDGRRRSWRCAEAELQRQGYHVGATDGRVSQQSTFALYAFQKLAGMRPEARFTNTHWDRLLQRPTRSPRRTDLGARHIEIDVARQLVLLFHNNKLVHAFHTSTGKPSTPTIRGIFTIYWKRPYRRPNGMYRSIFFHGGYALHGYPSVPLYPASAGCARLDDRDSEVLYDRVRVGDRVYVY